MVFCPREFSDILVLFVNQILFVPPMEYQSRPHTPKTLQSTGTKNITSDMTSCDMVMHVCYLLAIKKCGSLYFTETLANLI